MYEILFIILFVIFVLFLSFLVHLLKVLDFKKTFLNSKFDNDDLFIFYVRKKNIFYWFKLYKLFIGFHYGSSVQYFLDNWCNVVEDLK